MQIVFRAANIIEAHIVAGMLEANGIETHVGGHYLQGAVGDLPAFDFAHVFVDEANFSRAETLIDAYERGEQQDISD